MATKRTVVAHHCRTKLRGDGIRGIIFFFLKKNKLGSFVVCPRTVEPCLPASPSARVAYRVVLGRSVSWPQGSSTSRGRHLLSFFSRLQVISRQFPIPRPLALVLSVVVGYTSWLGQAANLNNDISIPPFPPPRSSPRCFSSLEKVLVSERLNNTPILGWILRILEFPGLGDCYQVHARLQGARHVAW